MIRIIGIIIVVPCVVLIASPFILMGILGDWFRPYDYVLEYAFQHVSVTLPVMFVVAILMMCAGVVMFAASRGRLQPRTYGKQLMFWGLSACVATILTWRVAGLMMQTVAKPVIYLYPETTTDVAVRLDYHGTLIADYPPYDTKIGGWRVTAQPDSTLTNHADGKEYSYLFWEGESARPVDWDLSTGFVVAGSDTRAFLQEKLAEIGLTPKEYNEFIVYWYPKMKDNPYNLIHFADTQYTDTAPLTITPAPDSMLRVFMVYAPLTHPVDVTPQTFTPFTRTGFTVVEWGGTEVE